MSSLWERFENIASAEEVNTAKAQFTPLPSGEYEVILESIEPSESKDGLPMLKGKFRVIENNRVVFYNQMLQNLNYPNMTAVNIAEAVSFIGAIKGEELEFTGLGALAREVELLPTGTQHKIALSYGKNDHDMKFPKIKIVPKPIELGDEVPSNYFGDNDVPF